MNFVEEFKQRGFFHQCTDEEGLTKLLKQENFAAYIGFDCTAPSLHVGGLMQIMTLRLLQKHGVKPIVILGGGTTKIGDPSGKDEARKLLTDEVIASNMASIKAQISKFIQFGNNANDAILVNNDDWLKDIKYIDFLRDYGRHFSINRMLSFDSVKLRLEREQNLTFLEFNYMILQAYDFSYLSQNYNCRLQVGGSDQWGNIVNGVELNRRLGLKELFGLTSPLITTASGAKMGKTAAGAVWLDGDLLPPFDYYQFWRNSDDRDVIRFLNIFTDLPIEQIQQYASWPADKINDLKKILAFECTKICHGIAAAEQAVETAKMIFESGELAGETVILSNVTSPLAAYALIAQTGKVESASEARRLIRGKAVKINGELVEDENQLFDLGKDDLHLSLGKKRHFIVKFN